MDDGKNMKLISWNVNRRTGKGIGDQMKALGKRSPDIVALQEVTIESVSEYISNLEKLGYREARDSFEGTKTVRRSGGVIIATCWKMKELPQLDEQFPFSEKVLSVRIKTTMWGDIEVHNVHIPPGSRHGIKKIETLEGVYRGLARYSRVPRILCGDFNAPQEEFIDGSILTWAYKKMKSGNIVFRAGRSERWDAGERNVLQGLHRYDLSDVYRSVHGFGASDFSWRQVRKGKETKRRYDHVFASKSLHPVACRYIHPLREAGLSDHSPIEVTFKSK
jgi:exonuclease III